MKREDKFLVLKIADVNAALYDHELIELER
jgi:hypothetical protein